MSATMPTTTATATTTNQGKRNLYFTATMSQGMINHFFALPRKRHGSPLLASSGFRLPS